MAQMTLHAATWGLAVIASLGWNVVPAAADGLELPTSPAAWLNSPPFSMELLKGKAAVFYFFEEGCPRCRDKWPEMLETAKKFHGQPVVFVGINSGNARDDVQGYVRACSINWPVIVDTNREVEKLFNVPEINLQNIYQTRILTGAGQLSPGRQSLEETAQAALQGATWNVDPNGLPASLMPAWQGVEFGNYAAGAPLIRKGLKAPQSDVKEAAEKLHTYVQEKLSSAFQTAQEADQAGQKWPAYQGYLAVSEQFKGYDQPPEVATKLKALANDPVVKNERIAQKLLDNAKQLLASGEPLTQRRAIPLLDRIVKDRAETSSAAEAHTLLEEARAAAVK